jgi:hypothetical protein
MYINITLRNQINVLGERTKGTIPTCRRICQVKVIVGVTTTKARLGIFFYAFQSLKRQTYDNFTIHISLSKEPYLFDDGIDAVPDWMAGENVQVEFVNNSGPYRKLLPLIGKIGEDDILVTADDDVLYSENWLQRLVDRSIENPKVITCCRARIIRKNIFGRFQNYSNWEVCIKAENGAHLLPTCGAGAVFRKSLLDLEFLSDEAYLECAPTADDIWFRLASIRKNTGVYVDPEIDEGNGYIRHPMGLEQVNLHRPNRRRLLCQRVIAVLTEKIANYFGVPLAKNDLMWKRALEYSKLRSEGSNTKRRAS